jgi:hypothetical protein
VIYRGWTLLTDSISNLPVIRSRRVVLTYLEAFANIQGWAEERRFLNAKPGSAASPNPAVK